MGIMNKFGKDIATLLKTYGQSYLAGAQSTIVLAVLCTAVGCLIGLVCGILQTIPYPQKGRPLFKAALWLIRAIVRVYVELFRGTPMILQAVFLYYALPYFTGNALRFPSVWLAAFTVVSINTGAYMAETVRGGILSIDIGQTEGAKAIGMTHYKSMRHVILPQTFRNILPQIGNNLIINIKDTSVMFIIGFTDLFAVHKAVVGATYLYFPSAFIEMGGYLVMTVICSIILRLIENKMDGPISYDLNTTDTLAHTSGTYNYPKKKATPPYVPQKEVTSHEKDHIGGAKFKQMLRRK